MGNTPHIDPPFGTYALPARRERIRLSGECHPDTRMGRWRISWARKRAIRGLSEPFDVNVHIDYPGVRARLYPSTNRCEKRALCGVQIWDDEERAALGGHVGGYPPEQLYVFLDVGANVGLYSLFINVEAQIAGRDIRLIAVEPSAEMGTRLTVNAAASNTNIELVRSAISTEAGEVFLSDGNGNHGEGKISAQGESVPAMTLLQLCELKKLDRIAALKLDIEGQDLAVLTQFFEQAPEHLHPHMMILELDETSADPLIELTQTYNYLIRTRTRMNVVVAKRDP